ncbi:MAG: HU family DNA-binding protein, partial [Thermodesulfobacteriota bacterium]
MTFSYALTSDRKTQETPEFFSLISKGFSCILSNNFKSKRRANKMAVQKKILTKGQIIAHFAEEFKISKRAATSMIDEYVNLAIAETKKRGTFVLPGIGKAVLVKRKARNGRN